MHGLNGADLHVEMQARRMQPIMRETAACLCTVYTHWCKTCIVPSGAL